MPKLEVRIEHIRGAQDVHGQFNVHSTDRVETSLLDLWSLT